MKAITRWFSLASVAAALFWLYFRLFSNARSQSSAAASRCPIAGGHADRRLTFRLLRRAAETVRLNGGDIPGNGQEPR